MQSALAYYRARPEAFPLPTYPYSAAKRVVWRNGKLQLDNGLCRFVSSVVYFAGHGPTRTANCKPNEVEIPRVIGAKVDDAQERLRLQPLTPLVVYKPALPKQRVDIVVDQFPKKGYASSFDEITIVVAKPLHGVVPKLVGLPLRDAVKRLRRMRLQPVVEAQSDGPRGRVVSQAPLPRVAAAPGMEVALVVGRG